MGVIEFDPLLVPTFLSRYLRYLRLSYESSIAGTPNINMALIGVQIGKIYQLTMLKHFSAFGSV